VLFFYHNIHLEHWLKHVCARLNRDIHVLSYQSLGEMLLARQHPDFDGRREEEGFWESGPLRLGKNGRRGETLFSP